MTCHFIIYNVKLGQSIGVLPSDNKHAVLIDCGHDDKFHPIDDFKRYLPLSKDGKRNSLRQLVLTNYDHDHFSGLPNLYSTVKIESVLVPKNLTMDEIKLMKGRTTPALDTLDTIRTTYTVGIQNYDPPFTRRAFALTQEDLTAAGIPIETNHLSQLMFLKYGDTTICVPGDLEERSWEVMMTKVGVRNCLRQTNIMVASHHGRENGYNPDIFKFCTPDCVILSDKAVIHGTQEAMSARYSKHVKGDGIYYTPATGIPTRRKTLTTRNDGHILITVPISGKPSYRAY